MGAHKKNLRIEAILSIRGLERLWKLFTILLVYISRKLV